MKQEIKQNELMDKEYKMVCTTQHYIDNFLILASTKTGCVSISGFVSLIGVPIGIRSSAIGLKIFTVAAGTKEYK